MRCRRLQMQKKLPPSEQPVYAPIKTPHIHDSDISMSAPTNPPRLVYFCTKNTLRKFYLVGVGESLFKSPVVGNTRKKGKAPEIDVGHKSSRFRSFLPKTKQRMLLSICSEQVLPASAS